MEEGGTKMSEIREKIAYLKGLLAGLGDMENEKNKKIWGAVFDVLDAVADEVEDLGDDLEDLGDYVGSIDDDLAEVEEEIYEDDDDDYDEDDAVTIECDNCGEEFEIPEVLLYNDEDVVCPHCGISIYDEDEDMVEFEDDSDDNQ
jgi:hypothetical protein